MGELAEDRARNNRHAFVSEIGLGVVRGVPARLPGFSLLGFSLVAAAFLMLLPAHWLAAETELKAQASPSEKRGTPASGIVLTPDGKPASGAQVGIGDWTVDVHLNGGQLSYDAAAASRGLKIIAADAGGRFRLPAEYNPLVIVVVHDTGYAEVDVPAPRGQSNEHPADSDEPANAPLDIPELKIVLQAWGRGIGILRTGGKPVAGAKFRLGGLSSNPVRQSPIRATHEVETDATGKFIVLRLPPGRAWCQRWIADSKGAYDFPLGGLLTHFDVPAGGLVRLELVSPVNTLRRCLTERRSAYCRHQSVGAAVRSAAGETPVRQPVSPVPFEMAIHFAQWNVQVLYFAGIQG
jgi:hypothetical protein